MNLRKILKSKALKYSLSICSLSAVLAVCNTPPQSQKAKALGKVFFGPCFGGGGSSKQKRPIYTGPSGGPGNNPKVPSFSRGGGGGNGIIKTPSSGPKTPTKPTTGIRETKF